jgi:hypothetical protein
MKNENSSEAVITGNDRMPCTSVESMGGRTSISVINGSVSMRIRLCRIADVQRILGLLDDDVRELHAIKLVSMEG